MSDVIHIISTPLKKKQKKKLLSKKYIPQMPRFISLILRKCHLFYAVHIARGQSMHCARRLL